MKKNLYIQTRKELKGLKKKNKNFFLRIVVLNTQFLSLKDKATINIRSAILINSFFRNVFFFNSSTKVRTQCLLTWRTRSIYSFFNLSRISLRELAGFGLIKGLKKASW